MANASGSSLLDLLRAKAEALRAEDDAARQPIERVRAEIDSCLWRAFRWLEEALRHLEVIHPTIARQFRIPDILTLHHPRFGRGFVSFRRRGMSASEEIEHVDVYYQLTGTAPVLLRVHPGAAPGIEQRLKVSTLQYEYQTEVDEQKVIRYGLFRIQPSIAATIRFKPDYWRRVIDVTLSNVDRFESVRLEFKPDGIDEAALEDLVRFMLGESNAFLHRAPLALIKPQRANVPADPPA